MKRGNQETSFLSFLRFSFLVSPFSARLLLSTRPMNQRELAQAGATTVVSILPYFRERCSEQTRRKAATQSHGTNATTPCPPGRQRS